MQSIACIIIGAGAVGLAIAKSLSPHLPCAVLEKNHQIGQETSSRNSGVIHAGLYYPNDWLKTTLSIKGRQKLYTYARQHNIGHKKLGKLIFAQSAAEFDALEALWRNAANNDIKLERLDRRAISQLEPELKAQAALFSPETGIIDVAAYCQTLALDCQNNGAIIALNQKVTAIERQTNGFIIEINHEDHIHCHFLINAAGLHASFIARLLALNTAPVYYCKGQYFSYTQTSPFKHLIYPLPLKNQQGLGIHATLDMAGQLRFGPDAHYCDSLDYRVNESDTDLFFSAIQAYFPALKAEHLAVDYSGIRPKLSAQGEAAKDFLIQGEEELGINNYIQLLGIESPGLTASLAIGDYIKKRFFNDFC